MKRLLIAGLLASSPAWCAFGFDDAIYWAQQFALMRQQIQQVQQVYGNLQQMAAYVRNPAQFLAQSVNLEQIALNTASRAGVTTSQRAAQLQQAIRMQQVAMQEAQTIQTISHSNMASIGMLANSMAENANQLAAVQQQLQSEQRTLYYQQSRTYQNQSDIISAWRMKP
jgi:hypothetical protein